MGFTDILVCCFFSVAGIELVKFQAPECSFFISGLFLQFPYDFKKKSMVYGVRGVIDEFTQGMLC